MKEPPDLSRPEAEALVSVVVPAYDAAATIDVTLRSVRAQTYNHLEIIVVDDGSKDETAEIVQQHIALDARVRLIRQPNGGVASARNAGILDAHGDYIAPIDADDVWAPDKIARQVAAMKADPNTTLCYTWYACLDPMWCITGYGGRQTDEGDVFHLMCKTNLVGNGSGAMMRKDTLVAVGLYDPTLRARGGQGCEDYKVYLSLAAMGKVAVIKEFLTGYRISPHNMSSDAAQMCRSHLLVLDEFGKSHPEFAAELKAGRHSFAQWLVLRAVRELRLTKIISLYFALAREDGVAAFALASRAPSFVAERAMLKLKRLLVKPGLAGSPPKRFPIGALEG